MAEKLLPVSEELVLRDAHSPRGRRMPHGFQVVVPGVAVDAVRVGRTRSEVSSGEQREAAGSEADGYT